MRRRWLWAGVATIGALLIVLFLVLGKEPSWTVTIRSNQTTATRWSSFELDALVQPRDSSSSLSIDGWSWSWSVDGVALPGNGSAQRWHTPKVGMHRVSVLVTSARGTTKTAEIELEVRNPPVAQVVQDIPGNVPQAPPVDPAVHDVPFGFEDVQVETSAVCAGEPSLIRTKATSTSGPAGNLVTSMEGVQGSSGAFLRLGGEPGLRKISMQLRDPKLPGAYAEESVYVELKNCVAPFVLLLDRHADNGLPDSYEFEAKLLAHGKVFTPSARAASYSWDFDDGHKQTTTDFIVRHKFPPEGERDDEHFHTYLVTVEAFDASQKSLAKAYASVFFYNLRRQSKDRGLIELPAHFRDIAELDMEGHKSMAVTLGNIDKAETVTLTEASVRSLDCDGKTENTATVPVASIFTNPTVMPNSSVSGTLTFAGGKKSRVCRLYVRVSGKSSPGNLDATGSFAMTVGNAFRHTITDTSQLEMVKTITGLLGKASFTQEDVQQLEEEGKIPRGALSSAALWR